MQCTTEDRKDVEDELADVVETAVRGIVDNPDDVVVTLVSTSYRTIVELVTNPADVGIVVGRGGSVVTGLRALIAAFAGKHQMKVDLDFVTEGQNARRSASR